MLEQVMKKLRLYQVDAFASEIFTGNPAAVCPLEKWLSDEQMQAIAAENNLSETAFFAPMGDDYAIRWFTPNTEVDLCGHATLASAYILFEKSGHQKSAITFHSKSGELRISKINNQLQMDFPVLSYQSIKPSAELIKALGLQPQETYESQYDLLCILENEYDVRAANPNLIAIAALPCRGIILTAPSTTADVYSRCFYPGCNVPEDPVTGSAHCVIAPYWCKHLNKNRIRAMQGLNRQGELICEIRDNRVLLSGTCHLYLEGVIYIPESQA
jgi:PhzF family phenazine biosynthesis protein